MDDFNFSANVVYENLNSLRATYPFLEIGSAGRSFLGKDIPYVRIGRGQKEVFYSAAIHANEWITTPLLMKFIEDYCVAYVTRSNLYDYPIRNLFNSTSIYIMPMVNPDGVDLVTGNLAVSSPYFQKALNIANQFPSITFPNGWKANLNGVDLENLQPVRKAL